MAQYDDEDEEMNQDEPSSNEEAAADTEAAERAPAEEEEPSEEEPSEEEPKSAPLPGPQAAVQGPVTDADKSAQLRQYLQDKMATRNAAFAKASDMSGVRAAQEEARRKANIAMWGEAFEGLAKARSMARGGHGVDSAFYQGIANQGQQGVHDALELRQAGIQDYLQKQAIQDRVAQQMMAQGTFEQKQKAAEYTQKMQDENSDQSKAARAVLTTIAPELASTPGFEKMSAAEAQNYTKAFSSIADTRVRATAIAEAAAARRQQAAEGAAARKQQQDDMAAEKTSREQDKGYKDLVDSAEGRGRAPKNISAALVTRNAIKKAQELIAEYPDLNAMPQIKVNLLAAELENVATGGAGTEAGRQGLDPGTFKEKLTHFMSRAEGAPKGAELGAFIKDNAEYLKGLDNVTSGIVNNYRKNLLTGSKRLIKPEHVAEYQQSYPEAFAEEKREGPSQSPALTPNDHASGTAIGAPAPQVDPKIAAFAKTHELDYITAKNIIEERLRSAK